MDTSTVNLLTLEEAAERLRAPVNTVRYWRATGQGPKFFKLGKRLVVTEAEIARYLTEQQAAAR